MESVYIAGEKLLLHPLKGIYWEATKTLLLADLHLGKGAHFRKAGIAVPRVVADANFQRWETMLNDLQPRRVLLLGDLFHSHLNHVWGMFCDFLEEFPGISFELIPGNHDILSDRAYENCRLIIRDEIITEGPFSFSHHPLKPEQRIAGKYNLCGHVHPCARLSDSTGHMMKLPCFYFGKEEGILPAFGQFTGCAVVPVKRGDQVFVLAEDSVLAVS